MVWIQFWQTNKLLLYGHLGHETTKCTIKYFWQVTGSGATSPMIGQWASILISLYDYLNNPITNSQDISTANISVELLLDSDRTNAIASTSADCTTSTSSLPGVVCTYRLVMPGWYMLNIYSGTNMIKSQLVQVGPGLISGANCIAAGDGVGTTGIPLFPGVPTTFTIQAFDYLNNSSPIDQAYFEVWGENLNQSGVIIPDSGYPLHISQNIFLVQYTPTKAGMYNLFIQRASINIVGSPFQIVVNVGPPVSSKCTLDEESLAPCTVMSYKNITLVSRDAYGNIRTTYEDVFHIFMSIDGFPDEAILDIMVSLGNGTYGYGFMCMNDTFVQIMSDANLVYSGMITSLLGPAHFSQTTLALDNPYTVAGSLGHGTIVTRDIAGHPLTTGSQALLLTYGTTFGTENDSMVIVDNNDGTYDVTFVILASGPYELQGILNEYWNFYTGTLIIVAGAPAVAIVSFGWYTASYESALEIQFFDENANNIMSNGLLDTSSLTLFFVSWEVPPRTVTLTSTSLGVNFSPTTGYYTVYFTPIIAGAVFVNFKLGGSDVLTSTGSSNTARVGFLPPDPLYFDIWGPGIVGAVPGEYTHFFIRIRDTLGTIIPDNVARGFRVSFDPPDVAPSGTVKRYITLGVVMLSYYPANTTNSSFTLSTTFNGRLVGNTSYSVAVTQFAGPIFVSNCAILGPDQVEVMTDVPIVATVGTSTAGIFFWVQPRDIYGTIITTPDPSVVDPFFIVTVQGGSGPPINVTTVQGGWEFIFVIPFVTVSGYLYVTVTSPATGGVWSAVSNSGFTIYLAPAQSYAPNSVIVSSNLLSKINPTQMIVGQWVQFIMQAYDQYHNPQIYNSYTTDLFSVVLTKAHSSTVLGSTIYGVNRYDLTYRISFQLMFVGLLNVTIYLNTLWVTSVQISVSTGPLYLPNLVMVDTVYPMTAGVPTNFLISASDVNQNPILNPGSIYCVFQNNVTMTKYGTMILPSNDTLGQFMVYFTPIKVGHYLILVGDSSSRNNGPTVNLWEVDVWPGPIALDMTVTSISSQVFIAGMLASFTITAVDAFSNPNYSIPLVMITSSNFEYYAASVSSPCTSAAAIGVFGTDSTGCVPVNATSTGQVSFVPTSYGKINMTIMWDSNTMIQYYGIQVLPATTPIVLSAQMSQNLGSIAVSFDLTTDAGYSSYVGLDNPRLGWQRCNNTLDPLSMAMIGINPNCVFKDATTLMIQLGYNATIMSLDWGVGDLVSISSGIFNQDDTSVPVTGWVPLGISNFSPPPVAVLQGPIVTNVCDNLTLDASASSGSAGRPMSYFFSVEGSGDDPYGLGNVVNFLAELPSQMTVTIGAGTLGADQVYIFQVVVTNFLGMTSTASLTVQTVQTSIPQVRYNSLLLLMYRGVLDIQSLFVANVKHCLDYSFVFQAPLPA